jgi:hypothetical protein
MDAPDALLDVVENVLKAVGENVLLLVQAVVVRPVLVEQALFNNLKG